jgi:hypothetical protein
LLLALLLHPLDGLLELLVVLGFQLGLGLLDDGAAGFLEAVELGLGLALFGI